MKMHPKPMSRHVHFVQPVTPRITYESAMEERGEPVHVTFKFTSGATQRLTMTRQEAAQYARDILAILQCSDPTR